MAQDVNTAYTGPLSLSVASLHQEKPLAVGLLYHPDYLKHFTGPQHPERPARLQAVMQALAASGQLRVTEEGYRRLTRVVKEIADQCCNHRLISVLEGGYHLDALGGSVHAHVDELQQTV